jgi:hypothetical protein
MLISFALPPKAVVHLRQTDVPPPSRSREDLSGSVQLARVQVSLHIQRLRPPSTMKARTLGYNGIE